MMVFVFLAMCLLANATVIFSYTEMLFIEVLLLQNKKSEELHSFAVGSSL